MHLNQDNENEIIVDDICAEVLSVLNAIKHPDISSQIDESRESVFDCVHKKIEAESILKLKKEKRLSFRYRLVAACAVCILLISLVSAFYTGQRSGKELLGRTTIETCSPYGVTTKLTLSDGTVVTLNGGSKLIYPTLFAEKERKVTLCGEGFFEVAKDREHPFVVDANNLSVRVLGTKFGFRSYPDDPHTIVTLEEGAVKATPLNKERKASIILEPDQQLILDNSTGEYQCRNVNTKEYVAWKEGDLYFRDNTLDEIARILVRKFNVKIRIIAEGIKNDRYFAHFEYGENVDQILNLLSHKRSWKFENKNGTIEIRKK